MSADQLFDGLAPAFDLAHGMHRPTDLETARDAAIISLPTVRANQLLILQLLFEHDWLTQFCPYVLMGGDVRYKQTAIGPRFKGLRCKRDGTPLEQPLIVQVENCRPRDGAESTNLVSAFKLTDAGREYLRANWPVGNQRANT